MSAQLSTHAAMIQSLLFPSCAPSGVLKKAKTMAAALPLIAQAMVESSGKQVRLTRLHGPTACTDGTVIAITDTALPRDNGDVEQFLFYMAMKMGLLHHEMGHVNATDFSLAMSQDTLTAHLENLIEDIRQERVHCAKVKNGRSTLRALAWAMVGMGIDVPVSDQTEPPQVFTGYLYARMRVEFCGELAYEPMLDIARVQLRRHFSPAFEIQLESLIAQVPHLASTADAMNLAEDFRSLIVQEIARQQQAQQSAQQSAGGQGQGSSQGQADGSGLPDPSQSQPGANDALQGSQATSQDGAATSGGGAGSAGKSDASTTDVSATSPDPAQLQAALQSILDGQGLDSGSRDAKVQSAIQAMNQALGSKGADVVAPNFDALQAAVDEKASQQNVRSGLSVDLSSAKSVVGAIRMRLSRLLHAKTHAKTGRSMQGHRIANKHLVGIATGDGRIFRKIEPVISMDTAICLLCDTSGSMSGGRIEVADQSLFAVASALESLPGISVAVAAFPGNQLVMPFGQRTRHHAQRFTLTASGGTPMAEGITMANRMLVGRSEPRKLLFVLTDGDPNNRPAARAAILASKYYGVEVYGIGIQTHSVESLFDKSTVISDVSELPVKLMAMVESRLRQIAA